MACLFFSTEEKIAVDESVTQHYSCVTELQEDEYQLQKEFLFMLTIMSQSAPAEWGWNTFHDSKFREKR